MNFTYEKLSFMLQLQSKIKNEMDKKQTRSLTLGENS